MDRRQIHYNLAKVIKLLDSKDIDMEYLDTAGSDI